MEHLRIYINNTKVANEIRKYNNLPGHAWSVSVSGKDKNLKVIYAITSDLSYYDCAVADAIYSLYKSDYDTFSVRHILHVLSGDEKQTLSAQKKANIEDSLTRLSKTELVIECTDEMRKREKIAPEETCELRGPFLTLTKTGKKYRLEDISDMPLYQYAEMNKQFISVPWEHLDVTSLTNTNENIVIKRFLIQRLEIMRNPNNRVLERKIIYSRTGGKDGMLADIGIQRKDYSEAGWKNKIRKIHNAVTTILDYYKYKEYIEDYKEIRGDGNVIRGVEIIGKIQNL